MSCLYCCSDHSSVCFTCLQECCWQCDVSDPESQETKTKAFGKCKPFIPLSLLNVNCSAVAQEAQICFCILQVLLIIAQNHRTCHYHNYCTCTNAYTSLSPIHTHTYCNVPILILHSVLCIYTHTHAHIQKPLSVPGSSKAPATAKVHFSEQKLRSIRTGETRMLQMFEDTDEEDSDDYPFSDIDDAHSKSKV